MPYNVEEVLDFLSEYKSRKEIREKFGLSNSESWHLVRWLEKANLIDVTNRIPIVGVPNRLKLYRTRPKNDKGNKR